MITALALAVVVIGGGWIGVAIGLLADAEHGRGWTR